MGPVIRSAGHGDFDKVCQSSQSVISMMKVCITFILPGAIYLASSQFNPNPRMDASKDPGSMNVNMNGVKLSVGKDKKDNRFGTEHHPYWHPHWEGAAWPYWHHRWEGSAGPYWNPRWYWESSKKQEVGNSQDKATEKRK